MTIKEGVERIGIVPDTTKTNTSTFLLPAFRLDKEMLGLNGYINSYLNDDKHETYHKEAVYMLFKTDRGQEFDEFIDYVETKHKVLEVYDIERGYTVLVIKFPTEYIKDFRLFKEGKYSKFSKAYIESFFPFKKVVAWDHEGKPCKEEYTLFYHIFHKTDWLKDWWAKRLAYDPAEFGDKELWSKPEDSKEFLRFNK